MFRVICCERVEIREDGVAGAHQVFGKTRKERTRRSEEKLVSFRSAFLFLARKWETVTKGGNHGDRPR